MEGLRKPTPEDFGWIENNQFDGEPSGYCCDGGEEAFYEALKKWEAIEKEKNK